RVLVVVLLGDLGRSEGAQSGAECHGVGPVRGEGDERGAESTAGAGGGTGRATQRLVGGLRVRGPETDEHHGGAGDALDRGDPGGRADRGGGADRVGGR